MRIHEINRLEEILVEVLGEPKSRLYDEMDGQRVFNCPRCAEENGGVPDGKFNLEVNISKNFCKGGVFQCWRCSGVDDQMKGSVFKLLKMYGSKTQYKEYREIVKTICTSQMYNIEGSEEYIEKPEIELPKTFRKIDLNGYCKPSVKQYLETRGIDQTIVDKFNLGYTEWEKDAKDWSYRIIIPSYDEFGSLNYYTGRDYLPERKDSKFVRPKYKNVKANKDEIVFQESLLEYNADIILCEGAIDCLFPVNAISLLGKKLTKSMKVFKDIKKKAMGRVIICLDSDTDINETKKIYRMLDFGRLKGKIWYIRLDKYKDFGELFEARGRKGVMKAISQAKQFTDIELIF